jgi:hypothetical protein
MAHRIRKPCGCEGTEPGSRSCGWVYAWAGTGTHAEAKASIRHTLHAHGLTWQAATRATQDIQPGDPRGYGWWLVWLHADQQHVTRDDGDLMPVDEEA